MKKVCIVAPHFIPSYLPSVHRARIWTYHLEEFGWKPIVLTTHPDYYECRIDPALEGLLPEDLRVIRVPALPTRPLRVVGDLSIRSWWWYRRTLHDLAAAGEIDFVHFTIPAWYSPLLGPGLWKRFQVPYGIDYIDPWIEETPIDEPWWSKRRISQYLAGKLEPYAVSRAALITGINRSYFHSVLERNPHLKDEAELAGMPYGNAAQDFEAVDRQLRRPFLFDPNDGKYHLIYAGAFLPNGGKVMEAFCSGLSHWLRTEPDKAGRIRVHFVGTGRYDGCSDKGHQVKPYIEKYGLESVMDETPERISYLDVLQHLRSAFAILILGSTEPHYSPSKSYQALSSGRPVFCMLHQDSTAIPVLEQSGAAQVMAFQPEAMPHSSVVAAELASFVERVEGEKLKLDCHVLDPVSARETTRVLAEAMDRALRRWKRL